MQHMHKYIILLLALIPGTLFAQQADSTSIENEDDEMLSLYIPPLNEKMKIGIKFGMGLYMMGGEEANKPYPLFGINGGMYFRYRFNNHFHLQPEAMISFRGGNFDNNINEYVTIRSYFVDLPVLAVYGLNEKNTVNVIAGAQYSHLLNSAILKKDAQYAEGEAPKLSVHDIMVITGAQFATPFIGFQVLLKYGLINANRGLVPSVNPVSRGKELHHMALELDFMF